MEEKRCSVCGSIVAEGDSFCQTCGSPVENKPSYDVPQDTPTVESTGVTEPTMPDIQTGADVEASQTITEPTMPTMPEADLGSEPTPDLSQGTTVLTGGSFDAMPQSGQSDSDQSAAGSYNAMGSYDAGTPAQPTYNTTGSYDAGTPAQSTYNTTSSYDAGTPAQPTYNTTGSYDAGASAQSTYNTTGSYNQQPAGTYNPSGYGSAGAYQTGAQTSYSPYPNANQPEKPKKGIGIAAMIFGILSILCCPLGLLFGLIGLILSIIGLAKKNGKGFSIVGLITSILGFIIGIVIIVSLVTGTGALADYVNEYGDDLLGDDFDNWSLDDDNTTEDFDWGYDDFDWGNDSSLDIADPSEVVIGDRTIYIPCYFSDLGIEVADDSADVVSELESNGFASGDYKLVVLQDTWYGDTFWGYIENTSGETVYSLENLALTGINVDNYSSECSASNMTAFGVELGMSRSQVESILGVSEYTNEDGFDVYESGDYALRVGYDGDYVEELDLTYYY